MNIVGAMGAFLGYTMLFVHVDAKNKPENFPTIVDTLTAGRRTGIIRHELKVTYGSFDALAQKMVQVLFRWKPILEHPSFNRTAEFVNTVSMSEMDSKNVHLVKYDVMITEAVNGLPKLNDKLAILLLEKSLKQRPIEGVEVASLKRSNVLDLFMSAGLPDQGGVLPF